MKSIFTALAKAQKTFESANKSSDNPHFRSKYAALDACVEAVRDSLNDNGIFLSQTTEPHDGGVVVETVFLHESGEQWSAGKLFVPASKHDAQGFGSAMTYARRYSLLAACGVAPEDDDGNAAAKTTPTKKAAAQPKAANEMDLSPKARAARIADGVKAGDAAGAAIAMSQWDGPLIDAVWALLPEATQTKLTAAWPKETA